MVSCPRCGANIDRSARACPYCQTETPYGREQAERQAAYQQHTAHTEQAQRAHERNLRQQALAKKAQHAMIWSLAATFTCCFPAAIVGLVMGLNVKGAAKRENIVAPGTSTVAVVFGCLSFALFGLGVAMYIHDSRQTESRIAVLKAQVDAAPAAERLEQPLACALTELELLKEGYAGTSGLNISGFECAGRVDQDGDRARLQDVRFRSSSSARHTVAACLARGARWSVKELRADGTCAVGAAAPSAAPSAPAP
ncbi:MAG: hypothetical protein EOO73_02645 [Myxococcales bacterium]|nr:MAG: hypothetical protein EOO73_02645 [Myxococcales bacterium]